MTAERSVLIEVGVVLATTFGTATWLGIPTLWLVIPVAFLLFTKRPIEDYGFRWQQDAGWTLHATVVPAVFVPYAIGHLLLVEWWWGATFALRLPDGFVWYAVDQILIVGLGEEAFFRGYLQTRLDQRYGRPWSVLGAAVGPGLVVAAAVFALCHVPFGGAGRLIVFFPGLLYGWLRARSGSLVAPVAYHGFSNVLMRLVVTGVS